MSAPAKMGRPRQVVDGRRVGVYLAADELEAVQEHRQKLVEKHGVDLSWNQALRLALRRFFKLPSPRATKR